MGTSVSGGPPSCNQPTSWIILVGRRTLETLKISHVGSGKAIMSNAEANALHQLRYVHVPYLLVYLCTDANHDYNLC